MSRSLCGEEEGVGAEALIDCVVGSECLGALVEVLVAGVEKVALVAVGRDDACEGDPHFFVEVAVAVDRREGFFRFDEEEGRVVGWLFPGAEGLIRVVGWAMHRGCEKDSGYAGHQPFGTQGFGRAGSVTGERLVERVKSGNWSSKRAGAGD